MGEVRFMISEAAKQVSVESHVLRYWEDELGLTIGRTEMGHRYYTRDDIQLFRCIKKLKDEGMLLKDLKPLIPELCETRLKLKKDSDTVSEDPVSKTEETPLPAAGLSPEPSGQASEPAEVVIPVKQLDQVRSLIGDVLSEVVSENNHVLTKDISSAVTADVIREMDFLLQAKERQEEEHFRKIDSLIRQQQSARKEAVKNNPIVKLRNIFT